jgi:hypothetical protein
MLKQITLGLLRHMRTINPVASRVGTGIDLERSMYRSRRRLNAKREVFDCSTGCTGISQAFEHVPVFGTRKYDTGPGIFNTDPLVVPEVLDNTRPRDEICFAGFARSLTELHCKEPNSPGLAEEIRNSVNLVNTLLVRVEVLGEVEFLVDDGLAFDREIIGRVEGVCKYVHVLAGELILFKPVSKPLDVAGLEKTVEAVDNLPLKITHLLPIGCNR